MNSEAKAKRLAGKSRYHRIQVELQQGYNLSPVEAQVLVRRVQQLVDDQTGTARQPGQVAHQAIAVGEPAGKPLAALAERSGLIRRPSFVLRPCW